MKISNGFLWLAMLCLFSLGQKSACAQVREKWVARFPEVQGVEFFTQLFASTLDHQGNPVVTGTSDLDYTTVKYDRNTGERIWVARYTEGHGIAFAITVDRVGDVFVTGYILQSATGRDFVTVKYDGDTGQQLWSARYNGPANANDDATALVVDSHGDLYVVGGSTGIGTSFDYVTIKYNGQTGNQMWIARYNSPGNTGEIARAVAVDREGNLFVTGSIGTIKYDDQTGQTLWGPVLSGGGTAITVDERGDLYVSGSKRTDDSSRIATYKLNGRTGQLLWEVISSVGRARAIALDSMGDVFVTGNTQTEKYSGQTGQVLWSRSLRGVCEALAVDQEDNVYVTGSSGGAWPAPIGDFRTVKFDGRTGRLLWQRTYYNAVGRAIAVDEHKNLYVSGVIGPDQVPRYLTIKYEQTPPGDVNLDFCVDDVDLLRILNTFGQSGNLPEDVNRDGVVDDQDLLMVLFNFGRGCGVE